MINPRPQIRSQNTHRDFIKSQSVVKRRKKRRKFQLVVAVIVFILLLVGVSQLAKIQNLQISKIVVVGNTNVSSDEIQNIANTYLSANYLGLFPERNALIYPKEKIMQAILTAFPRIQNVELYTESFTLLNIKIKERNASAVWCAAVKCYLVASDAYIYTEIEDSGVSSVGGSVGSSSAQESLQDSLPRLSGGDDIVGPEPVGKYIFTPDLFKNLLYAFGQIENMNIHVKDIQVFSRDEIVFNIKQNGKIIFSDRKPFEQSVDDLKSAFSSPVLTASSSFEYVDTRFGNKMFYKLKNATSTVGSSSASRL